MVVYKVIVTIKKEKSDEWFQWMSEEHIPEVINTGHFIDFTFMKRLPDENDDPNNSIFEIQYMCKDYYELDAYKKNDAERIRKKNTDKYQDVIVDIKRNDYIDMTIPELTEEMIC